jgi:beta-xylosidase
MFSKEGKGLIDPCPLWDEDGRAYVVLGFAVAERDEKCARIFEMTPDGIQALTESRLISMVIPIIQR